MSIKVFPVEDALAAYQANPEGVMVIEKKKEEKAFKGVRYLNQFWNIGTDIRKEGWFSAVDDIEITAGVADPADAEDKRNEHKGTRLQLETKMSKAGALGQFVDYADKDFINKITKLAADGTIAIGARKIHGLCQRVYSETHPKTPNMPMADPTIRFKLDFGVYPPKYPHKALAGKPKSQIYDYTKSYTDDKGVVRYELATVKVNGVEQPVNEDNLHLFITRGSIIKEIRFNMSSAAISQVWVSCPMMVSKVVIQPAPEEGFSDEAPSTTAVAAALTTTQATNAAEPTVGDNDAEEQAAAILAAVGIN